MSATCEPWDDYSWPCERACDALTQLVRVGRLNNRNPEISDPPESVFTSVNRFGMWLDAVSIPLGIEVEEIDAGYADVEAMLKTIGPGIVRVAGTEGVRLLVIVTSRRNRVRLLSPDGESREVPVSELRSLMCHHLESAAMNEVEMALSSVRLTSRRRQAATQTLLNHLLSEQRVSGIWTLRPSSDRGTWELLKSSKVPHWVTATALAQLVSSSLFVLSWWLLGDMMLNGRLELSWLTAWAIVIATMLPFQMFASFAEGFIAIAAGTLLKREVLKGAIAMDPDHVRQSGTGQLVGYVIESEIVESSALNASFHVLHGILDLLLALAILAFTTSNPLVAVALIVFLGIVAFFAHGYYKLRSQWTDMRLAMTSDLVEKLAGHRTRLVQEPRSRWSAGEDTPLEQYLSLSKRLDKMSVRLQVVVPRLWLIIGLAALSPSLLGTSDTSTIAIGIGGIMLAQQAIRSLTMGAVDSVAASIAWDRIRPFWESALTKREEYDATLSALTECCKTRAGESIIRVKGLQYCYPSRGISILDDVDLEIKSGEHVLLEGTSGSGKSTLAAILAGSREPTSGLLLAGGLDRKTLGERAWGKKIVVAPQFHDNHVMSATLAFNALMGCDWPPREDALAESERVLRGLELGPLLDRMPSGLFQTVGETGWQLSHGERSRLYVARALLQKADLLVLDESFAALDPETLEQTMSFVMSECPSLMIIAHP